MTEHLTWLHTNPGKWVMTAVALFVIAGLALLVEYIIEKRKK